MEECLVSVMQDGNEFATLCCSQAILERLTSENAGTGKKIRSYTVQGAGQWRFSRVQAAAGTKTKEVTRVALFIQGKGRAWILA